jgi:hypothetical protein
MREAPCHNDTRSRVCCGCNPTSVKAAAPLTNLPACTSQGVVPEGEWDAFIDVLRQPLPTTFRINGSGRYADGLRQKLESDFFANFAQGPIYVSRPGGGGLERG